MVVEAVPFNFPRTGRMFVQDDKRGNVVVHFSYLNNHGAVVTRSEGENLFSLMALNAECLPDYLPGILGEHVITARYLTAVEVDALLVRISNLPKRA